MVRGKSKSGYHRVSRPRKFLSFQHPTLGLIEDVSPRTAFILLNFQLTRLSQFNSMLIDVPEGDVIVYNEIKFKVVPHKYRHQ